MKNGVLFLKNLGDYRVGVAIAIVAVLSAFIVARWFLSGTQETDNAVVRCDVTDIVSEINGVISQINFVDNQFVTKGGVLVAVDDRELRAANERATAEMLTARSNAEGSSASRNIAETEARTLVVRTKAQLDATLQRVKAMEFERQEVYANLVIAQSREDSEIKNEARMRKLFDKQFLGQKHFDDAQRDLKLAIASREAAQARVQSYAARMVVEGSVLLEARANYNDARKSLSEKIAGAEANLAASEGQWVMAKADSQLAKIMLARTQIKALRSGNVANRRVALGDYIVAGQPIASITSCVDRLWIEANFKETQLENIRPKQPVRIEIDTYPGKTFEGYVESVSSGSGSTFSVLPPENATGNFTKVVQRFPVIIGLRKADWGLLRVGMSAVVTVDTR